MDTKVYILMYRSFSGTRLLNCRLVSVHATMKSAKEMLEALKFGHKQAFNDVKQDEKNKLKVHITSDTLQAEFEIEIHKCV